MNYCHVLIKHGNEESPHREIISSASHVMISQPRLITEGPIPNAWMDSWASLPAKTLGRRVFFATGLQKLGIKWHHQSDHTLATYLALRCGTWASKFFIIPWGNLTLSHMKSYKSHETSHAKSKYRHHHWSNRVELRTSRDRCVAWPRGFHFSTDDQGCIACTFASPIPGMPKTV